MKLNLKSNNFGKLLYKKISVNINTLIFLPSMDVYFWGVHSLKKIRLKSISRPKIIIQCGDKFVQSNVLANLKKYMNFLKPYNSVNIVSAFLYK